MELLSEKMELEKDNILVKEQEIEIENQLGDLKSKLDKLLDEKENIDKMSEVVDKKLKELNGKYDEIKNSNEKGDTYEMVRHEFGQVSSDRERILEKTQILDKKIEDLSNEFEIIVYERNKIRSEDEEIEARCKEMQTEFAAVTPNKNLSDSFLLQLEDIRIAKEDLLGEDKNTEEENRHLWMEAHILREQIKENSNKNACLDEDNEEIQTLFNKITTERNKLIESDKLLNGRYHVIYDNIQSVCNQRMENKTEIDTLDKKFESEINIGDGTDRKDSLKQEDLMLAMKQKEYQEVFEDWKKGKDSILQDNKDLDNLLDNLLGKFELLKTRKKIFVDADDLLEYQSNQLKDKFELNQKKKENIIQQFKETENQTNRIVEEFELSKKMEGSNELSDGDKHYNRQEEADESSKTLLEEFESLKEAKETLKKKDQEVSNRFVLAKSEFEDLTEEKSVIMKHQMEIESAYETLSKAFSKATEENTIKEERDNRISYLKEEIKELKKEKEECMKKDKIVAKTFDEYDQEIESLQNIKKELKTKQEEIEWQKCLLGNELESQ